MKIQWKLFESEKNFEKILILYSFGHKLNWEAQERKKEILVNEQVVFIKAQRKKKKNLKRKQKQCNFGFIFTYIS